MPTESTTLTTDAEVLPTPSDGSEPEPVAPPVERPPAGPSSERHVARPLGTTDAPYGYYEYLPPDYDEGPQPLLVFWHGSGEKGDGTSELSKVLHQGPPSLIENDEWPNERPFIVLSPQYDGEGCETRADIDGFLEFAIEAYDVDVSRVYLTGFSCGAIGIWTYLSYEGSELVAAAVPIAGRGVKAWNRAGCSMARVAIWGVHGSEDTVVLPSGTIQPIENLRECPEHADMQLTIYQGVGHGSWARTYNLAAGHDIYTWMLAQRRVF